MVTAFRRAGATSPATATTLAALHLSDGTASRQLRGHAVLREAAPGTYYLDEPSWTALEATRRRMAMIMLTIALVFLLGVVVTTRR